MKKIITILFSVLLAGAMLFSVTACEESPTPPPPVEQDYTVTFHYDFAADATFDADGKASAYASTAEYTSKKGKRVSLTTAMKDMFAMDGYKIKGYSTTAWQKDGITADMDVYVLYEKLGYYTITFQNPDGSVISTLNKNEGEALTAAEYPTGSAIQIADGYEFIGWDIASIEEVTQSVTIKALQGTTLQLEAEKSNYYFSEDPTNAAGKVITSTIGNGDLSVYHNNGVVVQEYTLTVEEDVTLVWGIGMWYRAGGTKALSEMLAFAVKAAGATEYTSVATDGELTCTDAWGDFQHATIGVINLKKGTNVLKVEGETYANVDYITLKGEIGGVHMNPYNLTLNGATFKDGKTTAKVEASGGLPVGIIVNVPNGMKLVGWTDGTETWEEGKFIMPEKDITISPVFKEQMSPQKNVSVGEATVTIDGVKDEAYEKINSAAGYLGGTKNSTINGDVYMAANDNGVYVYVDVTDDIVAVRGIESTKETDKNMSFRNDMIEFWFQYGDIHTKLQFDAFGLHVRSDEDGLAKTFARLDEVEYTTALKGDDNVESYRTSGAPTVSTATGYAIEFWLPLADEGESIVGNTMTWTLQINSISDLDASTYSVYGWKMKYDTEMEEVEKIFKADFVSSMKVEAESAKSATYSNGTAVATPAVSEASGGKYLHYTHTSSQGDATVTYEVTATEATTMALEIALGHRSAELNAINAQCKIYINDVEVTISEDLKFTIDGWEQDSDGDGVKGDWYTFEEFNLGNITLNEGVNTIKILISTDNAFEIDYLEFIGDTSVLSVATAE